MGLAILRLSNQIQQVVPNIYGSKEDEWFTMGKKGGSNHGPWNITMIEEVGSRIFTVQIRC